MSGNQTNSQTNYFSNSDSDTEWTLLEDTKPHWLYYDDSNVPYSEAKESGSMPALVDNSRDPTPYNFQEEEVSTLHEKSFTPHFTSTSAAASSKKEFHSDVAIITSTRHTWYPTLNIDPRRHNKSFYLQLPACSSHENACLALEMAARILHHLDPARLFSHTLFSTNFPTLVEENGRLFEGVCIVLKYSKKVPAHLRAALEDETQRLQIKDALLANVTATIQGLAGGTARLTV